MYSDKKQNLCKLYIIDLCETIPLHGMFLEYSVSYLAVSHRLMRMDILWLARATEPLSRCTHPANVAAITDSFYRHSVNMYRHREAFFRPIFVCPLFIPPFQIDESCRKKQVNVQALCPCYTPIGNSLGKFKQLSLPLDTSKVCTNNTNRP